MTIYLVVGAPRSGTSALAWALRDQGITMFVATDAPDQDSPTGNQEDNLARALNRRIMDGHGGVHRHDWDDPRYAPSEAGDAVRLIRAYTRLRERHAGGSWGVKDPRLCFAIEPWHAATSNLPVAWIHIYREDRDALVRSLIKMLPPRLRHAGDPATLNRLASSWAESYELACALGFERTRVEPFRLSYEELLTSTGQTRLAQRFHLKAPMTHIEPRFNRQGCPSRDPGSGGGPVGVP